CGAESRSALFRAICGMGCCNKSYGHSRFNAALDVHWDACIAARSLGRCVRYITGVAEAGAPSGVPTPSEEYEMRILTVLVALVTMPLVAGVAQERAHPKWSTGLRSGWKGAALPPGLAKCSVAKPANAGDVGVSRPVCGD